MQCRKKRKEVFRSMIHCLGEKHQITGKIRKKSIHDFTQNYQKPGRLTKVTWFDLKHTKILTEYDEYL